MYLHIIRGTEMNKEYDMISRIISKKETQLMLKSLRDAGLNVTKLAGGYECISNGVLLFKAMNGHHAYLVRMNSNLFT